MAQKKTFLKIFCSAQKLISEVMMWRGFLGKRSLHKGIFACHIDQFNIHLIDCIAVVIEGNFYGHSILRGTFQKTPVNKKFLVKATLYFSHISRYRNKIC